jgi:hypothetical protein
MLTLFFFFFFFFSPLVRGQVKYYDLLTDGIIFMQSDPRHAPTASVQVIVDWAHAAGVAPLSFFPLGSKQGAGGDPRDCLRKWQPTLFPGEEDVTLARRTGNYRNGIFYASRLLVRQRPREFWFRLFETVNATEMCAPITTANCKLEDHRPVKSPPTPPKQLCKSGPFGCAKSCNALEHVWAHVLCQPCHNRPKGDDPRYPWTGAAKSQEANAMAHAKAGGHGKRRRRRLAEEVEARRRAREGEARAQRISRQRRRT